MSNDAHDEYADTRIHEHVQPTETEDEDCEGQKKNLKPTLVSAENLCDDFPKLLHSILLHLNIEPTKFIH